MEQGKGLNIGNWTSNEIKIWGAWTTSNFECTIFLIENLKTSGKPDLTLAIAEVKQILIFCR